VGRKALSSGALEVLIALVIITVEFLAPRARLVLTPEIVALDVAAFVTVVVAVRWPKGGAALTVVMAITAAAVDENSLGFWGYLLMLPVVAALRTGRWAQAAVMAATVFITSVTATARKLGEEFDAFEVILGWLALDAVFVLVGLGLNAVSRNAAEAEARRQQDLRLRATLDLHDSVARELTLISMEADAAYQAGGAPPETLAALSERARNAGAALRDTIRMMQIGEAAGPDAGFAETLGQEIRVLKRRGHEVSASGDLTPALPVAVDRALAQIVREALHNVAKHGTRHGHCTIVGELSAVDYQLVIANQMASEQIPGTGLGTLGMRHRATLAGGTLHLASANGTWTCLVEMPLAARQLQA
jgi:signal transduction histidine kinase